MFGRKGRKAETVEAETVATTYSSSDFAPHAVVVRFTSSHAYTQPTVWQATRFEAERVAQSMRSEHPEWWDVQVVTA